MNSNQRTNVAHSINNFYYERTLRKQQTLQYELAKLKTSKQAVYNKK